MREARDIDYETAADALGKHEKTIRRIEAGAVGVSLGDLEILLNLYGVRDREVRAQMVDLQRAGMETTDWWSRLRPLPEPTTNTLLELESAASYMRIWEMAVVPGLLQTEAYAREVIEAVKGTYPPAEVSKAVHLRMRRQQEVFGRDWPEIQIVMDESVLRRPVGSSELMRDQWKKILDMTADGRILLQVLREEVGPHPVITGPMAIFRFPDDVRDPVVYMESAISGNLYLESTRDVAKASAAFDMLQALAESPPRSREMIEEALEALQ